MTEYWCNECKGQNGCLIEVNDLNNTDETDQFDDRGCDMIEGGFTKQPIWIPVKSPIKLPDKNYTVAVIRKTKSIPKRKKDYMRYEV